MVIIVGAGGLGLNAHWNLLKIPKCKVRLIMVDIDAQKLDAAAELGALQSN